MSQQATSSLSSIDDLDMIVDGDSHVTESIEAVLPYMDEDKYGAVKELISQSDIPLTEIFSATLATPAFPYTENKDVFGGVLEPEDKLEQLDEFGIDYSILDPTTFAILPTVNNSRFAVALAEAYNSWIVDHFLDEHERLKAALIVAPQKPSKAAEEIHRVGDEDDFVGVQLPATGLVPPPGHEQYKPIYEAAQEYDLPIMMHSGGAQSTKVFPVQYQWNETYAADHALSHPWTHMWNMTSLLYEGIPEKFPDLEFIFQEAGIGWIPYMMWRLDDHYLEMSYEIPALEKLPSSYIRNQFYFTTQPLGHVADNPKYIADMIEMIGPDRIMYSADIPHPDFDPPEELFGHIHNHLDDDDVRAVMGETAADLYEF